MLFTYFTLPAATTTLELAGEWFVPLFTEFWPWAAIAVGVGLCFALMSWLAGHFSINRQ